MPERVYLETTVVSYLTARPSRDLIVAGHQQLTHEWWDHCRANYELCISQLVLQEASAGDAAAAQERIEVLSALTVLELTEEAVALAEELTQIGVLPSKAGNDALHIAIAAIHRVPFLLTWNCRHLANATIRRQIESVFSRKNRTTPIICTPEELKEVTP